jgi:hypothetical protein
MANLKTKNVFVDTEVFEASNFNFSSKGLSELVRLAQANFVSVFLTSITVGEIQAHIVEKINEASGKLKKFRSEEGRILQNVSGYEAVSAKLDRQRCVEEIKRKFQEFLNDAKATVVDSRSVDPESVFRDYFDLKPPFGEGRKKEEFPDAFAQQALMNWCAKNRCEMYVISANKDWHAAKNHLIPLVKLDEFIDAAVKDEAGEMLAAHVLKIYAKHLDKVEIAIIDAFKDSEFYTSDVDGDVDGVAVKRIKIDQPFVLEVDEETATMSVDVEIKYVADVSYFNDDGGIWDGEDHVWSYRPTAYTEAEELERFEVELEIQYDLNKEDVFEVSCTINKPFRVTVLPTDYELK